MENNIITELISSINAFKAWSKEALIVNNIGGIPTAADIDKSRMYAKMAADVESKYLVALSARLDKEGLGKLNYTTPSSIIIPMATASSEKKEVVATAPVEQPTTPSDVVELAEVLEEVKTSPKSLRQLLVKNIIEKVNLATMWHAGKKEEAYARYNELMDTTTHHRREQIKELSAIAAEMKNEAAATTQRELKAKLDNLNLAYTTNIKNGFTGQELVDRSANYLIDGRFNTALLAGVDTEEAADPSDLMKLRAKQFLAAGQERNALNEIKTLFSEQGFTDDMARAFLFEMVRRDRFSELRNSVKALLMYFSIEKGDFHHGLGHVNNLVSFHSRNFAGKDKDGKDIYTSWADNKIRNFVDSCLHELVASGHLTLSEIKPGDQLTSDNVLVVDAETSIVETKEEEVIAPVAEVIAEVKEVKLSNKAAKAAKFKAEREAAKAVKVEEAKEVQAVVETPQATQESNTGLKSTEAGTPVSIYHQAATILKNAYAETECITKMTQIKLVNLIPHMFGEGWGNPLKWHAGVYNADATQNEKLKKSYRLRVSSLFREAGIPIDNFIIDNEKGEPVQMVNFQEVFKNKKGELVYKHTGKVIEETAPVALPETTESKKVEASAIPPITEDSIASTATVDAGLPLEQTVQHKVIDAEGTPIIEMAVTTAAKAELSTPEITEHTTESDIKDGVVKAMLVKTKNGWNAFIHGFKQVKVENAATMEEAQSELGLQLNTFKEKAERNNEKVESSKKGRKISIPVFIEKCKEIVFMTYVPKPAVAV